jgi:hypothetical protein
MKTRPRLAATPLLASLLLLAGCADIFGIGVASVEGEWNYAATNIVDADYSCDITAVRLDLVQRGRGFSGVADGALLICRGAGAGVESRILVAAPVVGGRIDGNRVRFSVGTTDWSHTAVVSGASMSGTVTLRIALADGQGIRTLTGPFGAAREPAAR